MCFACAWHFLFRGRMQFPPLFILKSSQFHYRIHSRCNDYRCYSVVKKTIPHRTHSSGRSLSHTDIWCIIICVRAYRCGDTSQLVSHSRRSRRHISNAIELLSPSLFYATGCALWTTRLHDQWEYILFISISSSFRQSRSWISLIISQ